MTKNRTTKWVAMLALVCALVLVFAVPAASAASYSKVYGQTTDRVRVRDRASTNGTIIDNIVKNACVYVTGSDESGSSTFVQVKYRASDGTVATGWICQSDGSTTYIKILSNDAAKKSYGVSGGNVPSKVVGTFTAAQRKASQSSADSTYVKEGSSGATVRDIQTKLKALGYYYAEITGNVGAKTKAAIKSFQAKNGLTADGIAGPQTIAKIDAVYAAKGSPSASSTSGTSGGNIKLGSTGTDVSQLQRDLASLGLYSAEITGSVGAKTEAAIREFQRKHGLSADGVAGAKTLAAIAAALKGGTASGSSGSTTLKLNSTGAEVSALQRNLTTLGIYSAEITGHYGAKTEAAVSKFQQVYGLTADGIAGAKTLAAIANAVTGKGGTVAGGEVTTTTMREGSSGSAVTQLQNMLKSLGYYYGEVTGHFGSLTKKAVKKFQEDYSLTVDGVAGAGTVNKLRALTGTTANGSGSGGSGTSVSDANSYGRVTGNSVRVRASASTSSKVITTLDKGQLFRIASVVTNGGSKWYEITVTVADGTVFRGYISATLSEQITRDQYVSGGGSNPDVYYSDEETLGVLRVIGDNVRLRNGPDTDYDIVGHANHGDTFYFVGMSNDWYKTRNGYWIHKDYVSVLSGQDEQDYLNFNANTTYRHGDTGTMVSWIQEALQALHFYGQGTDRGGEITGRFGDKTEAAVKDFQDSVNLPRDGVVGKATLDALRKAYAGGGSGATYALKDTVYNLNWFTYRDTAYNKAGLKRDAGKNKEIVLTDLTSGKSLYIYVQSVGNHADVEPLSLADTNTLCDIFGVSTPSQITYKRIPAVLTIGNYQFICAIYGVPHGQQVITNNGYNGQFCLHFLHSRTHGSNQEYYLNTNAVNDAITLVQNAGKTVVTDNPPADLL